MATPSPSLDTPAPPPDTPARPTTTGTCTDCGRKVRVTRGKQHSHDRNGRKMVIDECPGSRRPVALEAAGDATLAEEPPPEHDPAKMLGVPSDEHPELAGDASATPRPTDPVHGGDCPLTCHDERHPWNHPCLDIKRPPDSNGHRKALQGCGAQPGEPCQGLDGPAERAYHDARSDLARQISGTSLGGSALHTYPDPENLAHLEDRAATQPPADAPLACTCDDNAGDNPECPQHARPEAEPAKPKRAPSRRKPPATEPAAEPEDGAPAFEPRAKGQVSLSGDAPRIFIDATRRVSESAVFVSPNYQLSIGVDELLLLQALGPGSRDARMALLRRVRAKAKGEPSTSAYAQESAELLDRAFEADPSSLPRQE